MLLRFKLWDYQSPTVIKVEMMWSGNDCWNEYSDNCKDQMKIIGGPLEVIWLNALIYKGQNSDQRGQKSCSILYISLAREWVFVFFNPHPRTFFSLLLERERKGERETSMREKYKLVVFHMYPDQGSNLQPMYVPWAGTEPTNFQLRDDAPTNWAQRPGLRMRFLKAPSLLMPL